MNLARRWPAVLVGCALLLGGCGDGQGSTSNGAASSSTAARSIGEVSGGQDPFDHGPVTIPGAVQGGTVRVMAAHAPTGSLDPTTLHSSAVTSLLSGLVTRSLTQWAYDPVTDTTNVIGDLATTTGNHNDDYTKWSFTLRRGTTYEDGSKVTVRDIARGIRHCLTDRESVRSPCHGAPIRSVRTRGDTITFGLGRPYPDLPSLVTSAAFGPLPRQALDHPHAYGRHPLATGPYRIASYTPGRRLVLVRNDRWDPRSDAARTAYPDRYDVVSGRMSVARIARLIRGDRGPAQTTLTYDAVPVTASDRHHVRQRRLVRGATPCTTYVALDDRTLTDVRVRKALMWAYPYRRMMTHDGLVRGINALPATGVVPPPNFPDRGEPEVPGHADFATSARVARTMLQRADAVGTSLRLPAGTSATEVRALRAAGFAPRIVGDGPVDLRTRTACGHGTLGGAWVGAVYGTHAWVEKRMRRIDRLPLDQQRSAWIALDRHLLRRHRWIVPLWYDGVAMAHGSRIHGMADDAQLGMPAWSNLWVLP